MTDNNSPEMKTPCKGEVKASFRKNNPATRPCTYPALPGEEFCGVHLRSLRLKESKERADSILRIRRLDDFATLTNIGFKLNEIYPNPSTIHKYQPGCFTTTIKAVERIFEANYQAGFIEGHLARRLQSIDIKPTDPYGF